MKQVTSKRIYKTQKHQKLGNLERIFIQLAVIIHLFGYLRICMREGRIDWLVDTLFLLLLLGEDAQDKGHGGK